MEWFAALFLSIVALSAPAPVEASVSPVAWNQVVIEQPLTLQQRAEAVALKHGLSTTTFAALIENESRWDPTADNGEDRGLLQINRKSHAEVSDECAFDPDCAMEWAGAYIAKHGYDEWVVCNCYLYAQLKIKQRLPLAQHIVPNGPPIVGSIAIMKFGDVIHYQYVYGFDDTGYLYDGANRQPCTMKKGRDDWGDERLVGFWAPNR